MSPDTILNVKTSWAKVQPISEQAAGLFYGRLFEVYPEVRPLFKGDMKTQGDKLMAMINTAVDALDNIDTVVQPVKEMGARHADYARAGAEGAPGQTSETVWCSVSSTFKTTAAQLRSNEQID